MEAVDLLEDNQSRPHGKLESCQQHHDINNLHRHGWGDRKTYMVLENTLKLSLT